MPEGRALRVLVVDHPEVQRVIHNILEPQGYAVSDASPAEAARWLSGAAPEFDLLITNTLDCIAVIHAGLPVLCFSEGPANEFRTRCETRRCRTMRKPFLAHDLVEAVRHMLGESGSTSQ